MAYTPIDKSDDYFNTKLYTGNGSTQSITGVNFQPDMVWTKVRSTTDNHNLEDAVRGAGETLYPDLTLAEYTDATAITSFDSDGYSIGSQGNVNANTQTFVSWNWLASNTTASNTDGSITSTVSANTTSGFSIVSWTGTGANATIGHGLSTTPSMIIAKSRSAAGGWYIYHKSIGATKFLQLSNTDASTSNSTIWNNTEPTSSFFSTGTAFDNGTTYIAYCFAEKKGFSKFGSYVGNGSTDGSYIHLGFKPAWVMFKKTSGADNWLILDNKRSSSSGKNLVDFHLRANLSNAEADLSGSDNGVDFLSNGIKLRKDNGEFNSSGGTYIYMAFAENPFVTSTGIPATAR
jgi:hypothetical protein